MAIRKIIKLANVEPVDDDVDLDQKILGVHEEYKRVRKLIDLFVLALFLLFIMYTLI